MSVQGILEIIEEISPNSWRHLTDQKLEKSEREENQLKQKPYELTDTTLVSSIGLIIILFDSHQAHTVLTTIKFSPFSFLKVSGNCKRPSHEPRGIGY